MLRGVCLVGLALGVAPPAWAGVGDILGPRRDAPAVHAMAAPDPVDPAALWPVLPFEPRWIGRPAPEWGFIPEGRMYPARLAEIRYPRLGVRVIGSPRGHRPQLEIALGGQWAFIRWHPSGTDDWGLEIGGYGAYFMRFDLEHDTDLLVDDGIWGFPLSARWGPWSAKLQIGHISGHLGDETITHQGKEPINYLKEELTFALAWEPARWLHLYGEVAGALRMGIEHGPHKERPWRLGGGIEFRPFSEWPDSWPFYLALHAESRQEVGWNVSTTVSVGYVAWSDGFHRAWRFALDWHRGREVLTQFHDKRTQWWAITLTADW